MLEEKVREVFADMVVLKDPQRSEYFSNLSIPSYMAGLARHEILR